MSRPMLNMALMAPRFETLGRPRPAVDGVVLSRSVAMVLQCSLQERQQLVCLEAPMAFQCFQHSGNRPSQGHPGIAPALGVATRVVHGAVDDRDHVGEGASDLIVVNSRLGLDPTGSHAPRPPCRRCARAPGSSSNGPSMPVSPAFQDTKVSAPALLSQCMSRAPFAFPLRRGPPFRLLAGKASPDTLPAGLAGFGPDQTGPHQCSNDSKQSFVTHSPKSKCIWNYRGANDA